MTHSVSEAGSAVAKTCVLNRAVLLTQIMDAPNLWDASVCWDMLVKVASPSLPVGTEDT